MRNRSLGHCKRDAVRFFLSGREVVSCKRWSERAPPWGHGEGELNTYHKDLLVGFRGEGS